VLMFYEFHNLILYTMKKYNRLFAVLALVLFSLSFISCNDNDDDMMESYTITDVAASDANFSILVTALTKAGLADDLANPAGNFTVFAPTNAAFSALLTELGYDSLDDIPVATLTKVLLYHVKSGKSLASQITTGYYSSLAAGPTSGTYQSMYINMTAKKSMIGR